MSASLGVKQRSDFDLELTPMMGLMITLIPILLLSTVFLQVRIIETDLPQVLSEAILKDDENPTVWISLKVTSSEGCVLNWQKDGQVQSVQVNRGQNSPCDLGSLNLALTEVKTQFPAVYKIELNPEASVPYKDIVSIMDSARKSNTKKFEVLAKDGGVGRQTEFMFPNILFANVFGGQK